MDDHFEWRLYDLELDWTTVMLDYWKKKTKRKFVYDSGIRLNLVPDYFEMYLPVYSSNGWEMRQDNYNEKFAL
jgi:hypothetical protein